MTAAAKQPPNDAPPDSGKKPTGKAPGQTAPKPEKEPKTKAPAEPAKPPAPTKHASNTTVVKQLRRQRTRRLALRFLIFVVLPTLLATVYYGFVASDQYESYSQFTVHSAEVNPADGLTGLLGVIGRPTAGDTHIVREHIRSRDMLARLDEEHGFIAHYQSANMDFLSRLAPDASFEEAYEYYEDKVQAEYDTVSGTLTLLVRARSPEAAETFAKAIITHSEDKVNHLSERERQDRTRYAETEVKKCEARLTKARKRVLELQHEHAELNPLATAGAAMAVRTQLEGELANAKATLAEARSFMTDEAPQVRTAKERVKALAAQVAAEKKRLVNPGKGTGIADSLAEFDEAMVEKEFAQKGYELALATLEIARTDASRQHRYLAIVTAPSKPDESTYPERALQVLTVFIMSFLLLGIVSLLVAAVREHARV